MGLGSSSKNCAFILERIELVGFFDAVVDGNDISKSKPDPEVFLLTAKRLGISPEKCLVVEDATAGVQAAHAAGMPVLGVGYAAQDQSATWTAQSLEFITLEKIRSFSNEYARSRK